MQQSFYKNVSKRSVDMCLIMFYMFVLFNLYNYAFHFVKHISVKHRDNLSF